MHLKPPLFMFDRAALLLVLVRCNEPYHAVLHQLHASRMQYRIYQKVGGLCNRRPLPPSESASTREVRSNLGRECLGYVQFIVDSYAALPRRVAFLQWEAEMHMPLRGLGL